MMPPHLAAAFLAPDVVARRAAVPDDVLDDAIDAWHEDAGATAPLSVWLGMSDDEYALFVLDAGQPPGSYPPAELPARLAVCRRAFTGMVARQLLWTHPARKHLLAVLADPEHSPASRSAVLVHLTGSTEHAAILSRLVAGVDAVG